MKIATKLWIALGVLILLSPLGLILPEHFQAGSAWGEWGADEIGKLVGYVPEGLKRVSELWSAPLPDYAFKGWEEKGLGRLSFAYIISAVVGSVLVALTIGLLGKLLVKRANNA
ncbi:MAG: PDGLE domain-containing protein [Kiritimatiellia bacterium]|jgi:hypothetical protein